MRRKRLRISVTLAVLGLGMAIGWALGTPAPHHGADDVAAAQMQPSTRNDAQTRFELARKRGHAFQMPYFSFKTLASPVSTQSDM